MHEIVKLYKEEQGKYEDCRIKLEALLKELLIHHNLKYHKIESRIKDVDKLEEKIQRKNDKYKDISEITDIVGIRIITYFEDEVDKIAHVINKEFVKDEENSIDKRTLEMDKFGYRSLHYVVSINNSRKRLPEYNRFQSIKFEIQIRSILQHAWAEIEHDIGYKGELSIPDALKRNFYRVAALLETADIEFVKIREGQKQYELTVEKEIIENPEDVEINVVSLKSYVLNSEIVKDIDLEISRLAGFNLSGKNIALEADVERLYFLNIKSIQLLDTLLKKYSYYIKAFVIKWISPKATLVVSPGISIFYLCYVLVGEKKDIDFARKYFEEFFPFAEKDRALEIIEVYKSVSAPAN